MCSKRLNNMANFAPAGFEDDGENFEDYSFDDDDDDDCGVPFVRTTSQPQSYVEKTTPEAQPSGYSGSGDWNSSNVNPVIRPRSDIVTGSVPLDDFRAAAANGNVQALEQYLAQGGNVDHKFSTGWTALMHASNGCHPQVVELLLEHGANVNYACDQYSVLMAFCGTTHHRESNVLECVNILINHGAEVNAFDRYHVTPLLQGSRRGKADVVAALIDAGANINKQDNRGHTALMMAVQYGHIAVVRLLLEHKADVTRRSSDGSTAAELAMTNGHTKIQDMLERVEKGEEVKKKLVLTEDDVREIEAAAMATEKGSLLGKDLVTHGVVEFGELEMLLSGLSLPELIPLFHEQQVAFEDVLRMNDQDLVKMGVTRLGNRKKILDAVNNIHRKEWLPNSLTTMQYSKKITSSESVNMVQNLKKHVAYIACTVGYVGDHLRADSSILMTAEEGHGASELAAHTEEAMTNVRNLYQELIILRKHLGTVVGEDGYEPADLIKPKSTKARRKSRLRIVLKSSLVLGLLGVVVWKSDSIVKAVWKS